MISVATDPFSPTQSILTKHTCIQYISSKMQISALKLIKIRIRIQLESGLASLGYILKYNFF